MDTLASLALATEDPEDSLLEEVHMLEISTLFQNSCLDILLLRVFSNLLL